MERKVLMNSIFITLGAVAFLSGYLLMPRESSDNQTGSLIDRFNGTEVNSSENETPKILPVSNGKILSFINPLSNSRKIIAGDKNGNIIELDTADLGETVIANLKHNNISEILLSPNGDSAVYSFYDAKNNKKNFYLNFKKNEEVEISGNLKSAAFSPDGSQTAYLINTGDGGELLIAKGTNTIKRALKTRLNNATVSWPADFISLTSRDGSGYGDLFLLKDDGSLDKIISYQKDLKVKWSPSAEKLVFSAKDEGNSDHLFYKNTRNNSEIVDLDINTNVSKCVWSQDDTHIICGLAGQSSLQDEFYKINTADGLKTAVAASNVNLIVKEIALSRSEEFLYILNGLDEKLYFLKLK